MSTKAIIICDGCRAEIRSGAPNLTGRAFTGNIGNSRRPTGTNGLIHANLNVSGVYHGKEELTHLCPLCWLELLGYLTRDVQKLVDLDKEDAAGQDEAKRRNLEQLLEDARRHHPPSVIPPTRKPLTWPIVGDFPADIGDLLQNPKGSADAAPSEVEP